MHRKLDILAGQGYVVLRDRQGTPIAPAEWESLQYMDWKSGGDTNFAPLASATGEMDCRGFWEHDKPDKGGIWTANRELAPGLVGYVEQIGGTFGRVRVIKLNPSDEAAALRQLHRDDNNRLNPDGAGWVVRSWLELDDAPGESVFILRADRDDPATETRIPLHPGMQLVIDSERLYHVVWHPGPRPRYALITSWDSDDVIDRWIRRELPAAGNRGADPPGRGSNPGNSQLPHPAAHRGVLQATAAEGAGSPPPRAQVVRREPGAPAALSGGAGWSPSRPGRSARSP